MNAGDWLQVHTEEEIQKILPIAAKHQVPVTFRAAGTSLSGQALTDSVLLKLSHTGRNFRNYEIHVSPRSGSGMHGICSIDCREQQSGRTWNSRVPRAEVVP